MKKDSSIEKAERFVISLRYVRTICMVVSLLIWMLVYVYQFIRTDRLFPYDHFYCLDELMRFEWELEIAAFFLFTIASLIWVIEHSSGKKLKKRIKVMLGIPVYVLTIALLRWTLLFLKINSLDSLRHPRINLWNIIYSDVCFRQGDTLMRFTTFAVISLCVGISAVLLSGHLPDFEAFPRRHVGHVVRNFCKDIVCSVRRVTVSLLRRVNSLLERLIEFIRIKDTTQED